MELPKALQLRHRQVVAAQVQQRIQQHRAVAIRQYEPIAIGPVRIRGVMAQVATPQHLLNLGHSHGHAG